MKTLTRTEAAEWLKSRDRFCILTHHHPDGDTLGSAAALCRGLRSMGKTAHILYDPMVSKKLGFVVKGLTKHSPEEGDALIAVDVAVKGMVHRVCQSMDISLKIDHHPSVQQYALQELVDTDAAACGEIIYDLLMQMGVVPDKATAEALYVAVSTDTGCFRYANTTAKTLRVAAACAEAGGELYPINEALFETNSLKKLQVHSYITENAEFLMDGTVALCLLPKEVEEGATADDMDNIAGFLRAIEGVRLAVLIRQREDCCRMSVRAVPGYDASAVCRHFGGGGHKGASGANIDLPLTQAGEAVRQVLPELYGEKK